MNEGADPLEHPCVASLPTIPPSYSPASTSGSPGLLFFLPAGRIHAICSGCFVAEIQQTSDLTYRIYDYGRMGLDGKPRQLHTELAKEAIDYKVYPDYRVAYTPVKDAETELVSCKYMSTLSSW